MKKKRIWDRMFIAFVVMSSILALTACGGTSSKAGENEETGKLKITTTTGMIADAAKEVGGEHVEVTGLMGPGVDPHLYKASQGDIKKLEQADLILYNGLHLEGKMSDILLNLGKSKTVTQVTKDIPESELLMVPYGDKEEADPHVWFDVTKWIQVTDTIRDSLTQADPEHAKDYNDQADAYIAKLQDLHEEVSERITSIPKASRVLVTAHDAFGYFGQAYDIEVLGLQGISTSAEYGVNDVSELRDFLVDNQIKAVFVESSISPKAMEAIVAGAKEKGHTVTIGGQLYSDAMGQEGTEEGTYIGMVKHNTKVIVDALK
ncbi:zinc ABC transporter substrate-binding protein [Paenibacillus polygoni]|uniref:Zinc ABC transporter substrate-binding protein n=1 Tax=Paenibacillus polygoni TaxID=3050112 RepID=A0ABY8X2Y1_9BACL|nr:zinc ABC transporter substrate-binding protein [Paenibacillus polygoni]WIV18623.1 zinc ABC transporter substrate-binding protein [Paenibacillus polygoni]